MDQLQLYINNELVDLSDDSPIALTFQINNLADVKNQQGNTSNQFKLPLTQRNRQILGFPDDLAFTTNLPYQQYQAKLIQDGLEIIPCGIAELNGIDQDTANITVVSGNVDFFDAIDGKLYDMGDSTSVWTNYGQNLVWQPYDHTWNLDNVADSQQYTSGWIYPLIDYGLLDDDITKPVDVRNLRPGFFIKTAIELLLQASGYKATGSLLADPLYPLLIAQFSNGSFEHGTDYQNLVDNRGLEAEMLTPQTLLGKQGYFIWDTVNQDGSQQFTNRYLFNSKTKNVITITVTVPQVLFTGYNTQKNPSKLSMIIYYRDPSYPSTADTTLSTVDFGFDGHGEKFADGRVGSDPNGWTRLNNSNGSSLYASIELNDTVLSTQTDLPVDGGIFIGWSFQNYNNASAYFYSGFTLSIKSQNQTVQYDQTVQCERILPDISQKDLLKDTLQRFGIICQTNNASKTISFNSFRDIVNNIPIAKDWSAKCLNQGKQVAFQLGNYAQLNYMQYQNDDNVLPAKFGWSQIRINDQTLPATTALFTSPFGVTLNRPYNGGSIAQILMIDNKNDRTDFSISVAPRILIDQKFDLFKAGKTVTFTDGNGNTRLVNDMVSTPYFYKNGVQPSLLFDDLRKKYYPELEKILTQIKKVIRYILLTPRDILELDLLIPVYIQQDSAYYYINKIDAWRKGQPTKVELVKLG